jgi:hypothetical protein
MTAKFLEEVVAELTRLVHSTPSPLEFEMAYQAKVASDRIRFAVRQIDQSPTYSNGFREANLQLLDALDRLESAEGKFQACFRRAPGLNGHRWQPNNAGTPANQQTKGASI